MIKLMVIILFIAIVVIVARSVMLDEEKEHERHQAGIKLAYLDELVKRGADIDKAVDKL